MRSCGSSAHLQKVVIQGDQVFRPQSKAEITFEPSFSARLAVPFSPPSLSLFDPRQVSLVFAASIMTANAFVLLRHGWPEVLPPFSALGLVSAEIVAVAGGRVLHVSTELNTSHD
jgi:hypothetical protein